MIDPNKTIEQLENDYWRRPPLDATKLVFRCHYLRKKPLKDFSSEDFRVMITQKIGLKYLIPLSFIKLEKEILSAGDRYEGDLLNAVLSTPSSYWDSYPDQKQELTQIIMRNAEKIELTDTKNEALAGLIL